MTRPPASLPELLRNTVAAHGKSPALFYRQHCWSYDRLAEEVEATAGRLHRLGLHRGDAFALLLRNSPDFIVCALALARLGAVAVPINHFEKEDWIGFVFADAGVKGCLTSAEFLPAATAARAQAPGCQHLLLVEEGGAFPALSSLSGKPPPSESGWGPDTLALLLYTPGTTGRPKGVMLSHANLTANVESCRRAMEVGHKDRFICLLPMFHAFSWTVNVLLPLRLGASIVVMESPTPFEPVLKAIWDHKVTVFCGVPPLFAALTQKVRGLRAWVLRWMNPVRLAVSGASALPLRVLREFERKFRIPLLQGYGLTEASPVVAVQRLDASRKAGTVGPPLPGVEVQIVDEQESPLPKDNLGEICVRGPNVMAGYFKRTEETRATFTADGWLKTGDLGQLDAAGRLSIVDRKKDLMIVKGLNVYPPEVEAVLLGHPDAAEAAAVGVPDDTGDEVIHAFVVPKPGKTLSSLDLLERCRQVLAPFKVPRDIHVCAALPRNALGKILKKNLREEVLARRGGVV